MHSVHNPLSGKQINEIFSSKESTWKTFSRQQLTFDCFKVEESPPAGQEPNLQSLGILETLVTLAT